MIQLEHGNIVLVPFPYSDFSRFKLRPALVVSNESFQGEDIILCGITSRSSGINEVKVSPGDLVKGRIPVISYVRVGKIVSVRKSIIKKIVAKISAKKMREVADVLRKITKP
ncbi:type II toxin-antitoxin system PemK/MazF family toxin [Patescibacteria group bacterium]|nr:type II toxin-antitoxin system PemK/MazF family toxin [Patescibacteria group bacterium]MBU1703635.1 type II toxin-antitoxin system PemK/MazF family toxin [Patescibacteria group bacterium]MBU1954208.1 type II toxin-antitoxin system PemK/MazF family toxin [Patescibacteria group bacterium]